MKGIAACRGQEGDSRRKRRTRKKKTKKSRQKVETLWRVTKKVHVDATPCQFCLPA